MTEAEWLAGSEPEAMLAFLGREADGRRLRLFAAACARRAFDWLAREPAALAVVQTAELLADGRAGRADLQKARRALTGRSPVGLVWAARAKPADAARLFAEDVSLGAPQRHAALLRDIFGNPFRRRPFSPAWRTDTAAALARQMYESREFSAAPILADAIQDAGCDYDDLLNHLRDSEAVHVRGCWAVDLVVEKL